MTKSDRVRFPKGDAPFTRLVKKLSEERGLEVESHSQWNGYGYAVTSYTADSSVVEEARRIIDDRRHAEKAKKEERTRRLDEERQRAWSEEIAHLYPRMEVVPTYGTILYDGWASTPIKLCSRTQWSRIGYEVLSGQEARCYCCLHGGRTVVPLFSPQQVRSRRSRYARLSGESLWECHRAMGFGLVHAVWAANKLQKIKPQDKKHFYRLKDRFLATHQDYLVEGRIARHETSVCWECENQQYETCWKCDGSGIFSSQILYEHLLNFDGKAWSFHSYVSPRSVSDVPGANLKFYGKRFGPKDRVPFRLPEYIKLLTHVLEVPQ